jgi:hypothetical protein
MAIPAFPPALIPPELELVVMVDVALAGETVVDEVFEDVMEEDRLVSTNSDPVGMGPPSEGGVISVGNVLWEVEASTAIPEFVAP